MTTTPRSGPAVSAARYLRKKDFLPGHGALKHKCACDPPLALELICVFRRRCRDSVASTQPQLHPTPMASSTLFRSTLLILCFGQCSPLRLRRSPGPRGSRRRSAGYDRQSAGIALSRLIRGLARRQSVLAAPISKTRILNPLTRKRLFTATRFAVFALFCLFTERLFAQAQDGNFSSTPVDMVVNAGTNQERWATSSFGVMETVGLRQGEQITITLIAPDTWKTFPVGLAPLDGGEIVAAEYLVVDENGTASFTFTGGNVPGIYRVIVTVGGDQYLLQLYVARPDEVESIPCPP
jgi:hypothetical protein